MSTRNAPYLARQLSVFGPGRALNRRVNLCCVFPNPNGDANRIRKILSWFGQRRPYVQRGEYCISLHLSACIGVTSCERGRRSQVSRRGKKCILLEMLILEARECLVVFVLRRSFILLRCPSFLEGSPAFPFIGSGGGRGVDETLGRCLKGEGSTGAVEDVVATCSRNCRPSPEYRGGVRDGTVKYPRSCG
jgi:hypothetical protein